jgi:hypothetical protein
MITVVHADSSRRCGRSRATLRLSTRNSESFVPPSYANAFHLGDVPRPPRLPLVLHDPDCYMHAIDIWPDHMAVSPSLIARRTVQTSQTSK